MTTPAATLCTAGTFEVLANDRNYVWSATPLLGFRAVVGGVVNGSPRTICRAAYVDGADSYVEPGFTADGGGCTIALPYETGAVIVSSSGLQTLYAPLCG